MHFHRYEWKKSRSIDVYPGQNAPRPIRTDTEFSGRCSKCGKPKVMRIEGEWVGN